VPFLFFLCDDFQSSVRWDERFALKPGKAGQKQVNRIDCPVFDIIDPDNNIFYRRKTAINIFIKFNNNSLLNIMVIFKVLAGLLLKYICKHTERKKNDNRKVHL
jgi:hypothetical protein